MSTNTPFRRRIFGREELVTVLRPMTWPGPNRADCQIACVAECHLEVSEIMHHRGAD